METFVIINNEILYLNYGFFVFNESLDRKKKFLCEIGLLVKKIQNDPGKRSRSVRSWTRCVNLYSVCIYLDY